MSSDPTVRELLGRMKRGLQQAHAEQCSRNMDSLVVPVKLYTLLGYVADLRTAIEKMEQADKVSSQPHAMECKHCGIMVPSKEHDRAFALQECDNPVTGEGGEGDEEGE